MDPVTVGRYRADQFSPPGSGWLGYVETREWIVFEAEDGTLMVANGRTEAGSAIADEWVTIPRRVA